MNTKHLEAFITVAEYGSFSSAADALYISSPALQQQINRLESETGFKLFERGPGGVELTPAGSVFLEGTRDCRHRMATLIDRCREMAKAAVSIRVGAVAGMLPDLFSRVSGPFRAAYPHVLQKPMMESEDQLFSDLDSGVLDVVEYYDGARAHAPGRCYLPVISEGQDCLMSPNHPLAGRTELTLDDLRGQRLGVYSLERVAGLKEYLEANYPDIQLSEGNKNADYYSLIRFLENGALSLSPPHCRDLFPNLTVVPLKLDMRWTVGFVYREEPSELVRQFLNTAKEVFAAWR